MVATIVRPTNRPQHIAAPITAATVPNAPREPAQNSSSIANLDNRTSVAAVNAPRAAGITTGNSVNFSGQYLYDRLVDQDEDQVTKMDLVRSAVNQVDTNSWKKAVAEMVSIPKELLKRAIDQAREAGIDTDVDTTPDIVQLQSKLKTAQNHQSRLRLIFGALKNANTEMQQLGVTEKTGYFQAESIAKQALDMKGIKWDGTKDEEPEIKAARNRQKQERKILDELYKENPQQAGESIRDWNSRVMTMLEPRLANLDSDKHQEQIDKQARKIIDDLGDNLDEVLNRVMELMSQPPVTI